MIFILLVLIVNLNRTTGSHDRIEQQGMTPTLTLLLSKILYGIRPHWKYTVPPLQDENMGDCASFIELHTSISPKISSIFSCEAMADDTRFIISSFEYDLDGLVLSKFSILP